MITLAYLFYTTTRVLFYDLNVLRILWDIWNNCLAESSVTLFELFIFINDLLNFFNSLIKLLLMQCHWISTSRTLYRSWLYQVKFLNKLLKQRLLPLTADSISSSWKKVSIAIGFNRFRIPICFNGIEKKITFAMRDTRYIVTYW